MGTPEFAVTILNELLHNGCEVVGVVTSPDKPAGRGRKMHMSAVKKYATENDLLVLQPTNLKEEAFLKELGGLEANLYIVVAFRMLPRVVWQMPEYGTFNLHASLLPNYRGAAPINWALINGEKKTGVTTFFIDDKIDTGEIILQQEIAITERDSAGTLHDKLMHAGAELVLRTVLKIEAGTVTTKKQLMEAEMKAAPKIHRETCQIDWNQPLDKIYDHIRGLSPYPAAWTTLKNGEKEVFLKIYHVSREYGQHDLAHGQLIFDKKEIKVAVKGGYLELLEIQLPGKRKMKTREVLNGLVLEQTAYLA